MNKLNKNATILFNKRYAMKDEHGKLLESWEDLCKRVADYIALDEKHKEKINKWSKIYYDMIYDLRFIPNTPTLINAGKKDGQLAACFVLGIKDSMSTILDTLKEAAMIHKTGGGTGFSFSHLRPKNSRVKSTDGIASGPVSFMKMYNAVTEQIKQGGVRRGANMAILLVSHPDILEFIDAKQDTTELNNFNISVAVTDVFMKALAKDEEYNLIDPHNNKIVKKLKAKEIWDKICKNAWQTGEPGLFFIDTANTLNQYGEIESTNPCVTGDTKIATLEDIKTFKELAENKKDVLVYTWNPITKWPELSWMRNPRLTRKKTPIIEIEFDFDFKLKCTPDHNLYTIKGTKIQAKDLKVGQKIKQYTLYDDYYTVTNIQEAGIADVYNGTVDNTHCYIITNQKDYNDHAKGIVSANCGEEPLRNYESCNLGALNLTKYVINGKFDFNLLREDTYNATRFLDSVVSMNHYPLPIIEETHKETRKIGLGIMGFADTLIKLGITYGSKESQKFADEVYGNIHKWSYEVSDHLGKTKGIPKACRELKLKRRNLWTTTIAPTGSTSMLAGVSSGIEPIFAIAFIKNILDGSKFIEFNPLFEEALIKSNIEITQELKDKIISNQSIQHLKEIPQKIKDIFVTASDVTLEQHVQIQSIFQKYSDSGVSKTINLIESAKIEDVSKAFHLAYDLKCKGITVYRDGSRQNQVLSIQKENKTFERKVFNRIVIMKGTTEKIKTSFGNLLLTINENTQGNICEVILTIGKSGADINAFAEGIGRLISVALQHGIPVSKIAKQIKGVKGDEIIFHNGAKFTSILDLVAKRLIEYSKEKEEQEKELLLIKCPNCNTKMWRTDGCIMCPSCGYSKC